MTGGYLTLDFSDVKIANPAELMGTELGKRKGLYKYLQTNTNKPIYIIFSESMIKGIENFYSNKIKLWSNVFPCLNYICDEYIGTKITGIPLFVFLYYGGEPLQFEPAHISILVNEDDTISITDI